MSFYERMIEVDYNPFILFSHDGKVISLNQSAQFLLGSTSPQTIYEHAISHATTSFGFKTAHLDLKFGRFQFFAICVGYENEDEIGIMLYRTPSAEPKIDSTLQSRHNPVNIYSLIDLCVSTTSIGSDRTLVREFDPTLPEVRIDSDLFIKMLTLILSSSGDKNTVTLKLALNIGEHIKIDDKKYSLFSLTIINSISFDFEDKNRIENYASKLGAKIAFEDQDIIIDLAIIS